ncbi:uncharacterized protein LOC143915612 [Arctopsyche grandis]|uniref:uncharacterized protein LOC143915612 n=1 Tax=Arctopsyche grandis TaxID=121162 RepID=UPI00406D631E
MYRRRRPTSGRRTSRGVRERAIEEPVASRAKLTFQDMEGAVPIFTGNDDYPVEKWVAQIEEVAHSAGWGSMEKLLFGKRLVKGVAERFLRIQDGVYSWEKLKSALLEEFARMVSGASVHRRLSKSQKTSEESVNEYFYRMREMASVGSIEDRDLMEYVIDGIPGRSSMKGMLHGARNLKEFRDKLSAFEGLVEKVKAEEAAATVATAKAVPAPSTGGGWRPKARTPALIDTGSEDNLAGENFVHRCGIITSESVPVVRDQCNSSGAIRRKAAEGVRRADSDLKDGEQEKIKVERDKTSKPRVPIEVKLEQSLRREKEERASQEMSAHAEPNDSCSSEADGTSNMSHGQMVRTPLEPPASPSRAHLDYSSVRPNTENRSSTTDSIRMKNDESKHRKPCGIDVSNNEEDGVDMSDRSEDTGNGGLDMGDGSMDGDGLHIGRLWDNGDMAFSNKDEPPDGQFSKGQIDVTIMEKKIRPWIKKGVFGYIGEPGTILVNFICGKIPYGKPWGDGRSIADNIIGQPRGIATGIG